VAHRGLVRGGGESTVRRREPIDTGTTLAVPGTGRGREALVRSCVILGQF
jgi:hypothetical protein